MIKVIRSPDEWNGYGTAVFLAGGLSGCDAWQLPLIHRLVDDGTDDLTVLNPRRQEFDINDRFVEKEQIEWEFKHLRMASAIAFWFPRASICPIALFELGAWSITDKKIFVGCDRQYPRVRDIKIQMKLVRQDTIEVVDSLDSLAHQIEEWHDQSLSIDARPFAPRIKV